MKLNLILISIVLSLGSLHAQKPEEEIGLTLAHFIQDLNNLDLGSFIEHFSDDATVFYPGNAFPIERVKGKDSIKKEFGQFFNNIRAGRKGPPFLNIVPTSKEIKLYGEVAVVTLHFEMGEEFHRRTFVIQKIDNRWLINHLHASFLRRK
jgi:ketosteroid isomerase-like protein